MSATVIGFISVNSISSEYKLKANEISIIEKWCLLHDSQEILQALRIAIIAQKPEQAEVYILALRDRKVNANEKMLGPAPDPLGVLTMADYAKKYNMPKITQLLEEIHRSNTSPLRP